MNSEQRDFVLSLDRDGNIAPHDVVIAATPEDSPIHKLFTWDNDICGERYRNDQARVIIRRVRINSIASEPEVTQIRVSEYVHDAELPAHQPGYVRTGLLRTRKEGALAALDAELARVASFIARTRMIAAQLELSAECEVRLAALVAPVKAKRKAG